MRLTALRTAALAPAILTSALLACSNPASAADYLLKEVPSAQPLLVNQTLRAAGKLQVPAPDGKTGTALKLAVEGDLLYLTRSLNPTPQLPRRSARYYRTARARIEIDGKPATRELAPPLRLIVAEPSSTGPASRGVLAPGPLLYSPAGPMAREDVDFILSPADELYLSVLLPPAAVKIGDHWPIAGDDLAALLALDAVAESTLQATLDKVEGNAARVTFTGSVRGAAKGAEGTLEIGGHYLFDLSARRITQLSFTQKEKRSPGPVAPAIEVSATIDVLRTPVSAAPELADQVLATLPAAPAAGLLQLVYRSPDGRYAFTYDRDWYVFQASPEMTILRLVVRGEHLAQCNVIPLPSAAPGQHVDPKQFAQEVQKALGNQFQRFLQTGQVPTGDDRWVYRLSVGGAAGDIPLVRNYYVVAGPKGDQISFTFTLESRFFDRFANRDLPMVGSLAFLPPNSDQSARKPTPPSR